ncbi:DUF3888 domain-containing protein [Paenibacillus silvisoli]|uniref:DUF3888 domain-containing protein n=1 Tax=Paenibacillus silvisoli TaxID=3110539 RepID=UPI002805E888|nr:DUF3888 domain-containing protein [Paenibacillus silvisoli]
MKLLLSVLIAALLLLGQLAPDAGAAAPEKHYQDTKELQLQDMLVLYLLPDMQRQLAGVYADKLTALPDIYPYFVDIDHIEHVNGFRGFVFVLTLHVYPTVGPHISVGEDLMTYQISAGPTAKLAKLVHLKDPDPSAFPPNYKDLLRHRQ